MPHRVSHTSTATPALQQDKHFPFLQLPVELQVKILSFIEDLETLKSCLSLPEILFAVSSQLRYITNIQGNKLSYFHGIDKWVKQTKLYTPDHDIVHRDSNIGYIYLVELQYSAHLHIYASLKVLRNTRCFVAITGVTDKEQAKRYLRLSMDGDFCAVGVFTRSDTSTGV